jgi:hypothetical protein
MYDYIDSQLALCVDTCKISVDLTPYSQDILAAVAETICYDYMGRGWSNVYFEATPRQVLIVFER